MTRSSRSGAAAAALGCLFLSNQAVADAPFSASSSLEELTLAARTPFACWSCPLQPGNALLGEVLGFQWGTQAATMPPIQRAVGQGGSLVASTTGLVFVVDSSAAAAPCSVLALDGTSLQTVWNASLPVVDGACDVSLFLAEWGGGQLLASLRIGGGTTFAIFNARNGSILPPKVATEYLTGITDFNGNENILALGEGTGTVYDVEQPYDPLPLAMDANCSDATTSPDGSVIVCACQPLLPDRSLPTALCGFNGAVLLYSVPLSSSRGVASDAVARQLIVMPGRQAAIAVDTQSLSTGSQVLAMYDHTAGQHLWTLEYPWNATAGVTVVRVIASPAPLSFLWVVAHADPTSAEPGWTLVVNSTSGELLAQLPLSNAKPVAEGIVAAAGSDGYTLYVHVADATTASIAVVTFSSETGQASLAGHLSQPTAPGTLDASLYLVVGPLPGMLVTSGASGITVWNSNATAPSPSPTGSQTASSSASSTATVTHTPSPSHSPTAAAQAGGSNLPAAIGGIAGGAAACAALGVGLFCFWRRGSGSTFKSESDRDFLLLAEEYEKANWSTIASMAPAAREDAPQFQKQVGMLSGK